MRLTIATRDRRSIRLRGYDYTQAGAYFVTICTFGRATIFGEVADGVMRLTKAGEIAQYYWLDIPAHFPQVTLDAFVVMPNHLHGVLVLDVGARHAVPLRESFGQPVSGSIPTIVRSFKAATTKRINQLLGTSGLPVWQRNYYEHVIRTEADRDRIRQYIADNPARWAEDPENPTTHVRVQHAVLIRKTRI